MSPDDDSRGTAAPPTLGRPLLLRRVASWLAAALVVLGLVVGYQVLPGTGGPVGELRCQLSRPRTSVAWPQVALALLVWQQRDADRVETLTAMLLRDADPQVVENTLVLLSHWPRAELSPHAGAGAALLDWTPVTPLDPGTAEILATLRQRMSSR